MRLLLQLSQFGRAARSIHPLTPLALQENDGIPLTVAFTEIYCPPRTTRRRDRVRKSSRLKNETGEERGGRLENHAIDLERPGDTPSRFAGDFDGHRPTRAGRRPDK